MFNKKARKLKAILQDAAFVANVNYRKFREEFGVDEFFEAYFPRVSQLISRQFTAPDQRP
jgi:hypothetical protein